MNGFINILKPPGMTSAAVVGRLRRLTGEKRVGHAGTLDPEAAGILPVMVGKAARLFDYLVDKEKEYVAEVAFGVRTDTQDATGRVLEKSEHYPEEELVLQKLKMLEGDIMQRPGMFSALKKDGKPMYERARKGETVEVPERMVHVERITPLGFTANHGMLMAVRCGRGTYIRSICEDLGNLCGCPAHMRFLLRSVIGAFDLSTAITLEEAAAYAAEGTLRKHMIRPDAPLQHIPKIDVHDWAAPMVRGGAKLPVKAVAEDHPEGTVVRVYLNHEFWGMAERNEDHYAWKAQIAPEEDL